MKRFIVYVIVVFGIIVGSIFIADTYCGNSAALKYFVTMWMSVINIGIASIIIYIIEANIFIRKL